jgi:Zn-dependent peptidase ImmA (M78 family)
MTTKQAKPAELEAQQVLARAWVRAGGQYVVPVDPIYIAQELSLKVFTAQLQADVSGMLVKRVNEDAQIYVNVADSPNRQRFTIAHEIGHYILREHGRPGDSWSYIDHRGPSAAHGTDAHEVYANQFAAELLMPRDEVAIRYRDGRSAAALALDFDVSVGAMEFRVKNLGL